MQGGRHRDLILREDQLLAKAHRLRQKKEKAELDPFAPEYGDDTWHQVGAWWLVWWIIGHASWIGGRWRALAGCPLAA